MQRIGGETMVLYADLRERLRNSARRLVHEARNPLTVMKTHLELLGERVRNGEPIDKDIRVLRGEFSPATEGRLRNRVYDEAVAQALTVLWEAADRVCGKRLKPLIPMLVDAMERHGHLDLDPVIKTKVLQISAATIDRVLAAARAHIDGQRKRRKGVGAAIRRSIPVRTFADWLDPPPGFFEIDMVEHCGGPKTDGDYACRQSSAASLRRPPWKSRCARPPQPPDRHF